MRVGNQFQIGMKIIIWIIWNQMNFSFYFSLCFSFDFNQLFFFLCSFWVLLPFDWTHVVSVKTPEHTSSTAFVAGMQVCSLVFLVTIVLFVFEREVRSYDLCLLISAGLSLSWWLAWKSVQLAPCTLALYLIAYSAVWGYNAQVARERIAFSERKARVFVHLWWSQTCFAESLGLDANLLTCTEVRLHPDDSFKTGSETWNRCHKCLGMMVDFCCRLSGMRVLCILHFAIVSLSFGPSCSKIFLWSSMFDCKTCLGKFWGSLRKWPAHLPAMCSSLLGSWWGSGLWWHV